MNRLNRELETEAENKKKNPYEPTIHSQLRFKKFRQTTKVLAAYYYLRPSSRTYRIWKTINTK